MKYRMLGEHWFNWSVSMDSVRLMKEFLRIVFDHPVVIRKGKIVRCDTSDYTATVRILNNDGSEDEKFPEIPKVDIPIIWGRTNCGVFCPPEKDSICDVMFIGSDINFPVIISIRSNHHVPTVEDGALIIKNQSSCFKITKDTIEIIGDTINFSCDKLQLTANEIYLKGDVTVNGAFHVNGDITSSGANPNHHKH